MAETVTMWGLRYPGDNDEILTVSSVHRRKQDVIRWYCGLWSPLAMRRWSYWYCRGYRVRRVTVGWA